METFDKYNALYYRDFETYPRNKFLVMFGIFLLNFLLLSYLGIYKGVIAFQEKYSLYQEITELNKLLEINLDDVVEVESTLRRNKSIIAINNAIPDETNVKEYLDEVIEISQTHGFQINSFRVGVQTGETINISITTTGNSSELANFIESLETARRITKVTALTVSPERREDITRTTNNITLSIYTSGESRK